MIPGVHGVIRGNLDNVWGNCGLVSGDISGLTGDLTNVTGNATGVFGDLDTIIHRGNEIFDLIHVTKLTAG
jgi:hypothetical protein